MCSPDSWNIKQHLEYDCHMSDFASQISANKYRTHTNGELNKKHEGLRVVLSGWVHNRRDHGGLIFIDLRDKWGITQLTFDPSRGQELFAAAEKLRSEFVITVAGEVKARPAEMVNTNLTTGQIEITVSELTVQSTAKTPPFEIDDAIDANEEIRFTYRFLDLRRPKMQQLLKTRDVFILHLREYMHRQGFTEVQTPIIANSSPEGARDYLIPSRLYPGRFYALPQAPQQYKQLLMVGGLDRYFQIAPAFRDEDARLDRATGDFYQLDLEMSFVEQEDIWEVVEPLMIELTETFTNREITTRPFPRIPWREAMNRYGSDKPDVRFDLLIHNVSEPAGAGAFSVFNNALERGGVVHALHVPGGASFTRKQINELTEAAKVYGAKGLAYILVKESLSSPVIKHLGEDAAAAIVKQVKAQEGDAVFFGAGSWLTVCRSLGAVRSAAAGMLNLKDPTKASWLWVTDFPMYEFNEAKGQIDFSHNPFSMPQGGMDALAVEDPTTILAYQYDLVFNGFEISSGAIRNHRPDIMYKAFALAGYTKEEVDAKFGAMIRAFAYGAPPHGGFAPGIDRLFFLLMDLPNVRDVQAFPKDAKARDLMMGSPSPVSEKQLKELHISLDLDD